VEAAVRDLLPEAVVRRMIVPDEEARIQTALRAGLDGDVVITTGGTGLSPRDITPEVTEGFCDRMVPGIADYIRSESLQETPRAVLSRGVAGTRETTLVVNLPGSAKAADFCARRLAPLLPHAVAMMAGGGH